MAFAAITVGYSVSTTRNALLRGQDGPSDAEEVDAADLVGKVEFPDGHDWIGTGFYLGKYVCTAGHVGNLLGGVGGTFVFKGELYRIVECEDNRDGDMCLALPVDTKISHKGLDLSERSAFSGDRLYCCGYPQGVKTYSVGSMTEKYGKFDLADYCGLPGSSGSPVMEYDRSAHKFYVVGIHVIGVFFPAPGHETCRKALSGSTSRAEIAEQEKSLEQAK